MRTAIPKTLLHSLGTPSLKPIAFAYLALLIGAPTLGAAQDRWQVQLNNGAYVYDLRLVKLQDSSLVVRQADTTMTLPVRAIAQLVLVRGTMSRKAAKGGGHDVVYTLTPLNLAERLALLRTVLKTYPPTQAPSP